MYNAVYNDRKRISANPNSNNTLTLKHKNLENNCVIFYVQIPYNTVLYNT